MDLMLFYGEPTGAGNGEYMTAINPSMVQIIASISKLTKLYVIRRKLLKVISEFV